MHPWAAVRAAARAAGFGAWTWSAVRAHQLLCTVDPAYQEWPGKQRVVHQWSRGVLSIFGLGLHVLDDPPRPAGPYLVVANHRSPLDILFCIHFVGGVVLSNHEVERIPVIGAAARVNDTIFVDLESRNSAVSAVRKMRRTLQAGRNVIAFPEGNTFEGDEVRPFQPGTFAAARGLPGVQVLPLGLAYEPGSEYVDESFGTHLWRMTAKPRTRAWVCIGTPVPVPPRGEEEHVRQVVQGLVDRAVAARDHGGRDTGARGA